MREIVYLGTSWPLPDEVEEVSPGRFQGSAGLVEILLDDGYLIDPARCASANAEGHVVWELVRCRNGVALCGSAQDQGAWVLVLVVRADSQEIGDTELDWPEVVATYAMRREADLEAVRRALEIRVIDAADYGVLSDPGHSASGPVPLLRDWLTDDATGSSLFTQPIVASLVGGGWMYMKPPGECACDMHLVPLPWRGMERTRVEAQLDRMARATNMFCEIHCAIHAGVWRCTIGAGVSFHMWSEDGRKAVGALWTDAFDQGWLLEYSFCPHHGTELLPALETLAP